MNEGLTREQVELRATVRDVAEREIGPVAERLDREARFPYEIVATLGGLGLMGMIVPEELGGAGLDTLSYTVAIEELARVDSSVAITVAAHTGLGTMPIVLHGDERAAAALGARPGGRPAARRDRAHRARGGLGRRGLPHPRGGPPGRRLDARRREDVHHQLGHGHHGLLHGHRPRGRRRRQPASSCPPTPPGTGPARRCGRSDGAPRTPGRCTSTASSSAPRRAWGRRAPACARCSAPLDGGRIAIAAIGVGLAQGAFELALAHARDRRQFGRSIVGFQAIQFQLAEMATEIAAARSLLYSVARAKDAGGPVTKLAAMAKLTAGRLAQTVAERSLHIHGGYGWMEESPIARLYRDAKILEIGEGTSEVQKMVIARAIGAHD